MRHALILTLALAALSCAPDEWNRPAEQNKTMSHAAAAAEHILIAPEEVQWKDGPPSLPAGAQFAVLEGDPSKDGYFAMRLKLPDGYRIPPHSHPNVERLTVISGTARLGMGETFDQSASALTLPAGSYTSMQPGMRHFAWAEGETIIQLTTLGPWKINYVNPEDDPRQDR